MKLNKEEIMNDIDHEKVSQAFGLFVISKLKDEQLGSLLSQFRELFFDVSEVSLRNLNLILMM